MAVLHFVIKIVIANVNTIRFNHHCSEGNQTKGIQIMTTVQLNKLTQAASVLDELTDAEYDTLLDNGLSPMTTRDTLQAMVLAIIGTTPRFKVVKSQYGRDTIVKA